MPSDLESYHRQVRAVTVTLVWLWAWFVACETGPPCHYDLRLSSARPYRL
jgi:hypothetical protein